MKDMGVKWPAKVMKLGKDEKLETVLYLWFKPKREEEIPVTGAILQAKVCELHKWLSKARDDGAVQEFTASSGFRFSSLYNACRHMYTCSASDLQYKWLHFQ